MHADMSKDNKIIKIKRDICGYNLSDQYRAQEEREVRKWEEGIVYVCITCHIWLHIIGSAVVKIVLGNMNEERF